MASSRKKLSARTKPAAGAKLQRYGEQALERLAWLMQHAESEQAQVAAEELLERADGGAGRGEAPAGLGDVVERLRKLREKT